MVLSFSRARSVWSDPQRKLRTLESFGETEEDGGRDLEVAARRVVDPELKKHLLRHAEDEKRHSALFRKHAAELRAKTALTARAADESEAYDLSRGRKGHEIDAHGFFRAGLIDELGEVSYVAMLHVAEQRAAETFALHRGLTLDDPALTASFDEILRDEKYHVAYTQRFLEKWQAEGRAGEVARALKDARASRLIGAWKRLGIRSGAGFSQAVLFVLYWTLLLPFGLLARSKKAPLATRELTPGDARRSLTQQA
jgi:rubrerythrin